MNYHLLPLDSELFGFKVAKIMEPYLTSAQLHTLLNELAKEQVRLVYWPAATPDSENKLAATKLQGWLGSTQLTFTIELKRLTPPPPIDPTVVEYGATIPSPALEQLALQAGTYSHFKTDPHFPHELMVKLYQTWITNSVTGAIANKVLVIYRDTEIIGMLTLGVKNKRGDIGLLAVAPQFRGEKLGTKLVRAAQAYFITMGLTQAQVVTQAANHGACRLYTNCGFTPEKAENFYHFWL